jgi:hypothetical protein
MTGWSHGYGFGKETPHIGSICSDRGCISFSRNQHRLSPKSTHRLCPPGLRMARGLLQGSDGTYGSEDARGLFQRSNGFTSRKSRVEWWRNPPTQLISDALLACAWVDTCHPCNYVRSIHLEVTCPSKRT